MSNFTTDGCVLNMYADDVIIYTSAATSDDLQLKLQRCVDNIYQWYFRNKLTINKKKSAVMIIGSKMQLQSLNLDQFSINLESNKIELVTRAKYLVYWWKMISAGMSIFYNYVRIWTITFMSFVG